MISEDSISEDFISSIFAEIVNCGRFESESYGKSKKAGYIKPHNIF